MYKNITYSQAINQATHQAMKLQKKKRNTTLNIKNKAPITNKVEWSRIN